MTGRLAEANKEGDAKAIWDSEKPDEVAAARAQYDLLKKKGYAAFRVGADGKKTEKMKDFDPNAGSIIMVPNFAGG
jgi:hypothetical protein